MSIRPYGRLFEPIRIGNVVAKNRIEAAPALPLFANAEGCVSREMISYYRAKAKGGAGIVTIGDSNVDNSYGVTHANGLFLHSDKIIPALCELAETIKRYGALASLEINHGGAQTSPDLIGGKTPISPSPIASFFAEMLSGRKITSQEMTRQMMEEIKENYAAAALRLKRAGFDMALIHGAHGWLLAQFLSPRTNRRTDEYGGSLENRARFPIEVVESIRQRVGSDFALEYRFSADELYPEGVTVEDAVRFAVMLQEKVDCLHVSGGMTYVAESIHAFPRGMPPTYMPYAPNASLAERIKKAVSIPVTVVGGISDLDTARKLIENGQADLVAMARALIAEPELPNKGYRWGKNGTLYRPCIRCNECFGRVARQLPVRCSVNPIAGRELEFSRITLAEKKKKVIIIGGGPAGMEAAIIATLRGHQVTLYEKSSELGGNLAVAAIPSFKDDMKRFLNYLRGQVRKLPIELRMTTIATAEEVKTQGADVAIVAIGAEPGIPSIPGINERQAVAWAGQVLLKEVPVGNRVVIGGGGLIGCETGLYLAQEGKSVEIIEILDDIATDLNPVSRVGLINELRGNRVKVTTRRRIVEVGDGELVVVDGEGKPDVVKADTVVLAMGLEPRAEAVDEFMRLEPEVEVHAVGDCVSARKLMDAMREGFEVAAEI